VIKGVEVKEGKRREAVHNVMERIGMRVGVEEVRYLAKEKEDNREMVMVKLESEEQKREIMEKKWRLKGERERVMEDWT